MQRLPQMRWETCSEPSLNRLSLTGHPFANSHCHLQIFHPHKGWRPCVPWQCQGWCNCKSRPCYPHPLPLLILPSLLPPHLPLCRKFSLSPQSPNMTCGGPAEQLLGMASGRGRMAVSTYQSISFHLFNNNIIYFYVSYAKVEILPVLVLQTLSLVLAQPQRNWQEKNRQSSTIVCVSGLGLNKLWLLNIWTKTFTWQHHSFMKLYRLIFFIANNMIMLVVLSVPADACPGSSARERPTEETDRHSGSERPFDYFAHPHSGDFDLFWRYHPQQNPKKAIPKVFYTKDGTNRQWLTYCEASTVCMHVGVNLHVWTR